MFWHSSCPSVEDVLHGSGIMTKASGNVFNGKWENDVKHGRGENSVGK